MHKIRPKTTTVSIRIEEELLEHLRSEARRQSAQFNIDVSYADLLRDAAARLYPIEEAVVKSNS